jgi:hypothetical protein
MVDLPSSGRKTVSTVRFASSNSVINLAILLTKA